MFRSVLGWFVALVGATAAVLSPFRDWYDGRSGRDYRIGDLFSGVTDSEAGLAGSILLPFAFAALLTLVGLLLRSRLVVALAGVVVLGFTILWMVRVGQARGSLTINGDGTGLNLGVLYALVGGVLLLLAAAMMRGRGQRHRHRVDGKHRRQRHAPEHEPVREEEHEEHFPWPPGPDRPHAPNRHDPDRPHGPDDRPPPSPYHR